MVVGAKQPAVELGRLGKMEKGRARMVVEAKVGARAVERRRWSRCWKRSSQWWSATCTR